MSANDVMPAVKSTHLADARLRAAAGQGSSVKSRTGTILARQFDATTEVLASATIYSMPERRAILDQLRLVLTNFYVHLDRKKAQYGFDPVRALELLEPLAATLTDSEFHQSVAELIARTKDRHLVFLGRTPLGVSAVLPFVIEKCQAENETRYVVTKIVSGFIPQHLAIGAVVTHWNGIPVARFIELNANVFDGGNQAASLARSLEFLTQRPLNRFAAPMEEWVDLRFSLQGKFYEERFAWQGFDVSQTPLAPSIGRNISGFGGDIEMLFLRHANRVRFAPDSLDSFAVSAPPPADLGVPQILGTTRNFDYGSVTTIHGTFAYLRLWDFSADGPDDIANEFIEAIPQIPRNGLIIDMRGNSGGYIAAGERVLQLLTPLRITPSRFQFRVTPATREMVVTTDEFSVWRQSVAEAFLTGEPFSQGYPIEGTDGDANQIGQRYFGPVLLVTDALAFSTADVFAAGFVDHGIGQIMCVDANMAAAGGNNWLFPVVRLYNPDFQLDASLKPTFDAGVLTPDAFKAFNQNGFSLSSQATVAAAPPDYDGVAWRITDGSLAHLVRLLPWMNNSLNVYLNHGRNGLEDLPVGVQVSVTMRRCLRIGKHEGRLLEDLGIEADIVYTMSLKDILERNQDLNTRAALALSKVPTYDLDVTVESVGGAQVALCRTINVDSLEMFTSQRHLKTVGASNTKPSELPLPVGASVVEIRGFNGDKLVARRLITV